MLPCLGDLNLATSTEFVLDHEGGPIGPQVAHFLGKWHSIPNASQKDEEMWGCRDLPSETRRREQERHHDEERWNSYAEEPERVRFPVIVEVRLGVVPSYHRSQRSVRNMMLDQEDEKVQESDDTDDEEQREETEGQAKRRRKECSKRR